VLSRSIKSLFSHRLVWVGLVWGLFTGFSFAIFDNYALTLMGAGLILAIIGVSAATPSFDMSVLFEWSRTRTGLLIGFHALCALVSGILWDSSAASIARYIVLVPALSVCIAVLRLGPRATENFRLGITLSGLSFVLYHLFFLEPASLLDPTYRLTVFLNPNGVAFVSAMTAISLLCFLPPAHGISRLLIACGILACCVICFATKSRTGMVALLGGVSVTALLRASRTRRRWLSAALVVATACAFFGTSLLSAASSQISEVYSLHDRYRSIDTGTFRYETWGFVARELWLKHPIFGIGPGHQEALVEAALDVSGAHNGLLANLAEVGLLGTAPLLAILYMCLRRRTTLYEFALPLLAAALLESVSETMFFSMGNPGSLLFLLSVAALTSRAARSTTALSSRAGT
jgi:O-antigen ligase